MHTCSQNLLPFHLHLSVMWQTSTDTHSDTELDTITPVTLKWWFYVVNLYSHTHKQNLEPWHLSVGLTWWWFNVTTLHSLTHTHSHTQPSSTTTNKGGLISDRKMPHTLTWHASQYKVYKLIFYFRLFQHNLGAKQVGHLQQESLCVSRTPDLIWLVHSIQISFLPTTAMNEQTKCTFPCARYPAASRRADRALALRQLFSGPSGGGQPGLGSCWWRCGGPSPRGGASARNLCGAHRWCPFSFGRGRRGPGSGAGCWCWGGSARIIGDGRSGSAHSWRCFGRAGTDFGHFGQGWTRCVVLAFYTLLKDRNRRLLHHIQSAAELMITSAVGWMPCTIVMPAARQTSSKHK